LLLKRLSKAKGQILNISSIGGVNGTSKFPGLSIYSSSKGALTILTECLHEELKDFNVRVNALALGAVQTEMLDQAFPGYKADISPKQMAEFIDSIVVKGSQILNGQVLKVTGSNP
jgi:NAD(P)-dependent dehydrogenase (short-subunit alcohol dehydrogenase family)